MANDTLIDEDDYQWKCGLFPQDVCPGGTCCSQNFTCGGSVAHCGTGCHPEFGLCGLENVFPENKTCTPDRVCAYGLECCNVILGYTCGTDFAGHCWAGCISGNCYWRSTMFSTDPTATTHGGQLPTRELHARGQGLAAGAIVGISVASFAVFLILLLIAVFYVWRRRRSNDTSQKASEAPSVPEDDALSIEDDTIHGHRTVQPETNVQPHGPAKLHSPV